MSPICIPEEALEEQAWQDVEGPSPTGPTTGPSPALPEEVSFN